MNIEMIRSIVTSKISDPVTLKTGATISKKQYIEEFISNDMIARYNGDINQLIKETVANKKDETSKITKSNNSITITSPYLAVSLNTLTHKKGECADLLITLSLDDANKTQKFIQEYIDILSSCKTKEEAENLQNFLSAIKTVGEKGKSYEELLSPLTSSYINEISTQKIEKETYQEKEETKQNNGNQLEEIQKRIELLKMNLESELSQKAVNSDNLKTIAARMQKEVDNLDLLYVQNHNQDALLLRDSLEFEIKKIKNQASMIEDMARQIQY